MIHNSGTKKLNRASLIIFVGAILALWSKSAMAQSQIVPDKTLGDESSQVRNNVEVKGIPSEVIEGGAQRGANLFHSFSEFNISEGRGAYFANPAGIEHILGRVTGANPSEILGTLGVLGNADLFLINPNGIIFGENARLDVAGSFVGTTASAVQFGSQGFFSATEPNSPPLLTVSPSAFFFNQIAAQPIQVNSGGFQEQEEPNLEKLYNEGLRVPDNKSLVRLGGNVTFNGGSLEAPGGRIELAGVAGLGTVGLTENDGDLRLNFPDSVTRADVSLNQFLADVVSGGGGSIRVTARNLDIFDNSELRAGIGEGLGSVNARAGDITLNATGAVAVVDSNITNFVGNERSAVLKLPTLGAVGQGGDINIQANSLFLGDISDTLWIEFASLSTGTNGQGDAGNIFIQAKESVSLSSAEIASNVWSKAVGRGGNIDIQAGSFSTTGFSTLSTTILGRGNGGSIIIRAKDSVLLRGSRIFSQVLSTGIGQGGDMNIEAETGSISITGGTDINTNTFGLGDAGDVVIRANDSVLLEGSFIQTISDSNEPGVPESRAVGDAGDIIIHAGSLSLIDSLPGGFFAALSSSTYATGDAGNITISVDNSISIKNSFVISIVGSEGIGKGGDIIFEAKSLTLNGSSMFANTLGRGRAGNIRVNASNFVNLFEFDPFGFTSSIITDTGKEANGEPGDIIVNTNNFRLSDGAVVSARTLNSRNGGSITINANTFEALDGGQVVTTSLSSGNAGSIILNVKDSVLLSGEDLTFDKRISELVAEFGEDAVSISSVSPFSSLLANTASGSTGNSGNIVINSNLVTIKEDAKLAVNSNGSGQGGDITLEADLLTLNDGSITVETASNQGGNINLQIQDLLNLRNNSKITATAGTAQADGNGGNIKIDTDFVIATPLENSDIVAKAFQGKGGNINITAQSIFGIEERRAILGNETNDIDASSEFGSEGTIEINTPDIDPNRGLIQLLTQPIDTEVAQACTPGSSQGQSEFFITGRGGLPPNPNETLSSDAITVDLVDINPDVAEKIERYGDAETRRHREDLELTKRSYSQSEVPNQIIEAQGMVVDENGEVLLIASVPEITPSLSSPNLQRCHENN